MFQQHEARFAWQIPPVTTPIARPVSVSPGNRAPRGKRRREAPPGDGPKWGGMAEEPAIDVDLKLSRSAISDK